MLQGHHSMAWMSGKAALQSMRLIMFADSIHGVSSACTVLPFCCCRLVVMSATLGGGLAEDLQDLMGQAAAASSADSSSSSSSSSSGSASVPVVISEGRSYPVTTHFLGKPCE
jgi:HrpA-like RNA helicase